MNVSWPDTTQAIAGLLAIGSCGVTFGVAGIVVGAVAVLGWLGMGLAYGLAIIGLGSAIAAAPQPEITALAGAGAAGLLFGATDLVRHDPGREGLFWFLFAGLGLGVTGWASHAIGGVYGATVGIVGITALASYGMHRYEQVRLGLVSADGQ